MSEIPWNNLVTKIGVIIICVVALYVTFQALSWGYITSQEFMLVLGAILTAWGIGIVGARTYGLGKKSGYQQGYNVGLKYALELKESLKEK